MAVTRRPAIIDTNVVVAAFPTTQEISPVTLVLDGMLHGAFCFVLSCALLAEYRDVLTRTAVRKLHGLTDSAVKAILTDFAQHATMLTPVAAPNAPDPGDQLLWELLAARADVILVTQDKLLLCDAGMRGRVISPEAFVACN